MAKEKDARHATRFPLCPSPNGLLHLGHALSAVLNHDMAKATNGRFLLRIEDIDQTRCRPEFEVAISRDLAWLGLNWERPCAASRTTSMPMRQRSNG